MTADDSCKFDPVKKVNFSEAAISTESALAFVGKIIWNKMSEADVKGCFAKADRNDFVAVSSRGFSGDDADAVDQAYAYV